MKDIPQRINAMYSEISDILDTPGAFHRCRVCVHEIAHNPGDGGYYTRYGWPKHCDRTMEFIQPSRQSRKSRKRR